MSFAWFFPGFWLEGGLDPSGPHWDFDGVGSGLCFYLTKG